MIPILFVIYTIYCTAFSYCLFGRSMLIAAVELIRRDTRKPREDPSLMLSFYLRAFSINTDLISSLH